MRFRVGGKRNRRALRWGARAGGWRLPARRVGRAGSAPRAARWSLSASAVRQAPVLPAGTSGRRAVRGAGASLLPGRSRGRAERWGGLTARAGRPASGRAATGGSGAAAPGTAGTYPPRPPFPDREGGRGTVAPLGWLGRTARLDSVGAPPVVNRVWGLLSIETISGGAGSGWRAWAVVRGAGVAAVALAVFRAPGSRWAGPPGSAGAGTGAVAL